MVSRDEAPVLSGPQLAGCPAPGRLGAFTDGAGEDPALRAHLSRCALCRALVRGLCTGARRDPDGLGLPEAGSTGTEEGGASAGTGARRRWLGCVLQLIVLALLGVGAWLLLRGCWGGGAPPDAPARRSVQDAEQDLQREIAALVAARPELFGGFALLDEAALAAPGPRLDPEAPGPQAPRDTILSGRPTFRWLPAGRVKNYVLTLTGPDGAAVFTQRVEGTEGLLPTGVAALAPGAYTFEVTCKRTTGTERAGATFRVADATEIARATELEREIRARVQGSRADLLVAHAALRAGWLDVAERAALAYQRADAAGLLAQATHKAVLRRRGTLP